MYQKMFHTDPQTGQKLRCPLSGRHSTRSDSETPDFAPGEHNVHVYILKQAFGSGTRDEARQLRLFPKIQDSQLISNIDKTCDLNDRGFLIRFLQRLSL